MLNRGLIVALLAVSQVFLWIYGGIMSGYIDKCFDGKTDSCNVVLKWLILPSENWCDALLCRPLGCDANLCRSIGNVYEKSGDTQRMIGYYQKATDSGDYIAPHALGIYYYKNADLANATKYLQIACENPKAIEEKALKAESCYNLSVAFLNSKDYENALHYAKIACDLNGAKACYNAGSLIKSGQGTQKNLTKGNAFHKKACEIEPNLKVCEKSATLGEIHANLKNTKDSNVKHII